MDHHLTAYQWPTGQSGNPHGRPPKLKSVLRGYGLSPAQAADVINSMLLCTRPMLQDITEDQDAPIIEAIIARALIKSAERGNLHALELLLVRAHGLPKPLEPVLPSEPISVTLNLNQ